MGLILYKKTCTLISLLADKARWVPAGVRCEFQRATASSYVCQTVQLPGFRLTDDVNAVVVVVVVIVVVVVTSCRNLAIRS